MKKIYSRVETKQNPDFSAKFVSCLSLKFRDGKIFTYTGEIKGKITWPPKGNNGFGYDPFSFQLMRIKHMVRLNIAKKFLQTIEVWHSKNLLKFI